MFIKESLWKDYKLIEFEFDKKSKACLSEQPRR